MNRIFLLGLLGCYCASSVLAEEAWIRERMVPIGDLIQELASFLQEHPDNAAAALELARMNCFAYAFDREFFSLAPDTAEIEYPRVQEYPVPHCSATRVFPVSPARLNHLAEAIVLLRGVVEKSPENPDAWMTLGYACAEAAKRCTGSHLFRQRMAIAESDLLNREETAYWEDTALEALRQARMLRKAALSPDAKEDVVYKLKRDAIESLFIARILAGRRTLTELEIAELREVEAEAMAPNNSYGLFYSPRHDNAASPDYVVPAEMLARIEAIYPQVPMARNGAEFYLHAADALRVWGIVPEEQIPILGSYELKIPAEPFPRESLNRMKEIVGWNTESLRFLQSGLAYSDYYYPLDYRKGSDADIFGLRGVGNLVDLGLLHALTSAEEGDAKSAAESVEASIGVTRSLLPIPTAISGGFWSLRVRRVIPAMEQVVNRVHMMEEDLLRLQSAVVTLEDPSALDCYLHYLKWIFELPQQPIPPERIAPPGIDLSEEEYRASEQRILEAAKEVAAMELNALSKFMPFAKLPVHELYPMIRSFERDNEGAPSAAHDVSKSIEMGINHYVQLAARVRVAATALAVMRFELQTGILPESLEELTSGFIDKKFLVDPYSGELLQFYTGDDRFVVYSVSTTRINQRYRDPLSGISFTVMRDQASEERGESQ